MKSFCCFADVISLWCLGKAGIDVGDEFADAIEQHGVAFHAAYKDRQAYIPKFHFAKHLPLQGGFYVDTLVCERYHTRTKNIADPIKNTSSFERSVLSRALAGHLNLLQVEAVFGSALLQPTFVDACIGHNAEFSKGMRWKGTEIHADDIVRLNGHPCIVVGCFCSQGAFGLLCQALVFVEEVTAAATRWTKEACTRSAFLDGVIVRYCVCWAEQADDRVLICDRGSIFRKR